MLYPFFLGDSPASECYVPTFRNILSHIHRWYKQERTVFRNVDTNSDAGESPKRRIQHSESGEILKTRKAMFNEEYSYYTLRHSLKDKKS